MSLLRHLLGGKKDNSDQPASGSKYWPFAAVAIVLILVVAFLLVRGVGAMSDAASKTVDKTVDAFRPKVTIQTVISNAIGEIRRESKWVVMSTELSVTIEKSSTKNVAWELLSLGTTTVAFRASDNIVQYIIPTESLTKESVIWNDKTATLQVTMPQPVLDESIVEVQSDPDKCQIRTDIGWARFKSRSGKALENSIRKELRPSVIQSGNHEVLLSEAARKGQEAVRDFFINFMTTNGLEGDVRVVVKGED